MSLTKARTWNDRRQLRVHLLEHRVMLLGCWVWPSRQPYPTIRVDGEKVGVHVVAAWAFSGIPRSDRAVYICHTCDNTRCWRPKHLFAGTPSDNIQDCVRKGRNARARNTHCPKGHPFDSENTYIFNGARHCRVCRAEAERRYRTNHARFKGWI